MSERHKETFPQRGHTDGTKQVRSCLTSLAIRKMQIKGIRRYHYTPIRMAEMKNSDHSKMLEKMHRNWINLCCGDVKLLQ